MNINIHDLHINEHKSLDINITGSGIYSNILSVHYPVLHTVPSFGWLPVSLLATYEISPS